MPLDPNIPLAVNPPQTVNPMQVYLQLQQLQNQRLNQQALAEERQQRAQEFATTNQINQFRLGELQRQQRVHDQTVGIIKQLNGNNVGDLLKGADPDVATAVNAYINDDEQRKAQMAERSNQSLKKAMRAVLTISGPNGPIDPALVQGAVERDGRPEVMQIYQQLKDNPAGLRNGVVAMASYGEKPEAFTLKGPGGAEVRYEQSGGPGTPPTQIATAPAEPVTVTGWMTVPGQKPKLVEGQRDPATGVVKYGGQVVPTDQWQPLAANLTPEQQKNVQLQAAQAAEAWAKAREANQNLAAGAALFGPTSAPGVSAPPTVGATPAPTAGSPRAAVPSGGAPAGPPLAAPPTAGPPQAVTYDLPFGAHPTGRDETYLSTLPPAGQNLIRGIADGKQPYPTGRALTSPLGQQVITALNKYDPTYDQANPTARIKARVAFTSGKEAQQINALNTAIGHLDELTHATDALKNGDYQTWNAFANKFKTLTGWTGQTNFDTIAPRVAEEVTRLWRGAGGSEADIQRDLKTMNSSMAPGQLYGVIGTTAHMMEDKLKSLAQQYATGMGTDPVTMISPAARATLDRLDSLTGGGASPPATPAVDALRQKYKY